MTIHILEGINEWDETDTWIDSEGFPHPTRIRMQMEVSFCGIDCSGGDFVYIEDADAATCEECIEKYALCALGGF